MTAGPDADVPLPPAPAPMKAVSDVLPRDDGWAFEVKWDGMRIIAACDHGRLRLWSGRSNDVTASFGELQALADELADHRVVLDGEVVAFGPRGRPDFGRLQQRMHVGGAAAVARAADVPVTYLIFDVLWLDGHDLTGQPYTDRRRLLEALVEPGPSWRVPPSHEGDGDAWLRAVTEQGLEGLVAKRLDSTYEAGKRSPAWRKIKVRRRQELVVAGWVEGDGGLAGELGGLVVAYHDDAGRLVYAGRVGSGISDPERRRLRAELTRREVASSPIDVGVPTTWDRPVHHCRPEVVVEVAFAEWTGDGVLRHPSYVGERTDVDADRVVREPFPGD